MLSVLFGMLPWYCDICSYTAPKYNCEYCLREWLVVLAVATRATIPVTDFEMALPPSCTRASAPMHAQHTLL